MPTIDFGSLIAKSDIIHPLLSSEGVIYTYATPPRTNGFKLFLSCGNLYT